MNGSTFPSIGPDVTGGDIPSLGGVAYNIPAEQCFINGPVDPQYATVSNNVAATWSNGIAIASLDANAAEINPASTITITGMSPAGYNCRHCVVTATTNTTVSYALAADPGGSGSGGTAYWPDVALFNARTCYSP